MTSDEEWVEAAMSDDVMVVELLLRLKQSYPLLSVALKPTALPLEWSVRQRRSKPFVTDSTTKPGLRASPTTPLSWSGAASISGGCGGSAGIVDGGPEESSRSSDPKLSKPPRSEVNGDGEKSMKRSRKKKTLAELQVEEYLLDKEKGELKRKIAALRTNLEKQKATNDSLKRLKLESATERRSLIESEKAIHCQFQQKSEAQYHIPIFPPFVLGNGGSLQCYPPNGPSEDKTVAPCEAKFVLPDLNLNLEEESSLYVLCG
ncbi:uncharacterized protein LOC111391781 [Olea europaea var. sylvestris]|uniref:uncharacterized protein LOC111391781 n=1 Tax=Olea europaea var. sylvestris TaxID=158386 RepID=UPI000C1D782D|nr:uncharacterized protein LOC111391781 [Olea europaea var. sylvestris]